MTKKFIALLMIFIITLSGCVRMEYNLNVNEDESAEFGMLFIMNSEAIKNMGGEQSEPQISGLEKFDSDIWDINEVVKNIDGIEWKGVDAVLKAESLESIEKHISEVSQETSSSEEMEVPTSIPVTDMTLDVNKEESQTTYTLNLRTVPLEGMEQNSEEVDESTQQMVSMMMSSIIAIFNINMPGEIIESSVPFNVGDSKITINMMTMTSVEDIKIVSVVKNEIVLDELTEETNITDNNVEDIRIVEENLISESTELENNSIIQEVNIEDKADVNKSNLPLTEILLAIIILSILLLSFVIWISVRNKK